VRFFVLVLILGTNGSRDAARRFASFCRNRWESILSMRTLHGEWEID
jgi:hypothetical protein